MTITDMMPDPVGISDPSGRSISEVGITHPVLLALYAQGLSKAGLPARALLVQASLVADRRCRFCGRRLSSPLSLALGFGPSHCR